MKKTNTLPAVADKKLELKRNVVKKFSIRSGVKAGSGCTTGSCQYSCDVTYSSTMPPSTNHNPARARR